MKRTHRPIILCPAATMIKGTERLYVNGAYALSIKRAGGVLLTLNCARMIDIRYLLENHIDGILLQGGCDIHPNSYNQEPESEHLGPTDNRRDGVELYLVKKALEMKLPILAICRGMQILNVALGGTLHQHLPAKYLKLHTQSEDPGCRSFLRHQVTIDQSSQLRKSFRGSRIWVNSLHHQGIDKLGRGIKAVATAPDGLIEAIEYGSCIGVQWHPEEIPSKMLFQNFIDSMR